MNKHSHAIETYKLTVRMNDVCLQSPPMKPHVRQQAKFFEPLLKDCQVYEVEPNIAHFALNQEPFDLDAPVSHECASPADKLFVSYDFGSGFFVEKVKHRYYLYSVLTLNWMDYVKEHIDTVEGTPMTLLATYELGEQLELCYKSEEPNVFVYAKHGEEDMTGFEDKKSKKTLSNAWELVRYYLMILRVINSPRLTVKKPAGTRQQRRSEARGMGKAVDAWHRVSWNIDKPSVAKEPYDQGFHKMPLHFNRGHWKRAEKHHPKSRQRPNALRPEHRTGWWTWIDGYFAGHPAFGFKKQYHRPQITKVA